MTDVRTGSPLVFLDTETTGLLLTDDIWEFAAMRRETDGTESELHLFIEHSEVKCASLPEPFKTDHAARFPSACSSLACTPREAAARIWNFLHGKPHIIGAVPNFDTERLAILYETVPHCRPNWHYHLIDVENLAVGYLNGSNKLGKIGERTAPPWDSDWLSNAVGVDPARFDRHTAMGDVLWAKAIYDAVMGI